MQRIKEDIKTGQYKSAYLLYGTEEYLKNFYKNKLKEAMLNGGIDMNYSNFEGKSIDVNQVIEIADTIPFLSERRVVVIQDSNLFKSQSILPDYIKRIPEFTHMIFVEAEVDKRNRLYKAIKDIGTISEMNGLDEKNLLLWITGLLKKDNKKITKATLDYFLSKVSQDMENIITELEKLICYTLGRDIITPEDIDAVCSTVISNKIFQMIEYIGNKNQLKALELYYDLLTLREKPMSILFLISRHFNLLMQIKNLFALGQNNQVISKKAGVPPFAVNKYIAQGKNFSIETLIHALNTCVEIEEKIKTGRLIDQIGVEMLIVQYSQTVEDKY